ncbi:MAG: ATP-binding protein [Chthoniobacteraceae bacterium]
MKNASPGSNALGDVEGWQHTLDRFAVATGLTVVLYSSQGKLVVPPKASNPLSTLLLASGAWEKGGRCHIDGRQAALQAVKSGDVVRVESLGTLSICAIPIRGTRRPIGAISAGWVFTNYPEPVSMDRFARELGMPFTELWQVVRQIPPVSEAKLLQYSELLAIISQLFVSHHLDRKERSSMVAHLQTQQSQLERAARARDEFLAVVSHELRTPLTPILGWLPLIKEHLNNGQLDLVREGLDVIERNALQETHLIDEMLDLSRILVDRIVFSPERVSVAEIVRETASVARVVTRDQQLSVGMELAERLPEIIVDRKRLLQSLANLVSNAVKFTPDGGRITVGARRSSDGVEFFVSDTGIGLAPKALELIFDRFKQAEAGFNRRFGGLGIGLSVVRGLVEMQGGRVWAESPGEGLGTTFFLAFPAAAGEPEPEPESRRTEDDQRAAASLSGDEQRRLRGASKVLLVDDAPDTLNIMRRLLERAGFRVTIANNAHAAIEAATISPPDVLLTDLGMPDCDGMELLARLRKGSLRQLPAIALTGFTGESDRQNAEAAGFDAYFTKPLDIPVVLEALDRLLADSVARGNGVKGLEN